MITKPFADLLDSSLITTEIRIVGERCLVQRCESSKLYLGCFSDIFCFRVAKNHLSLECNYLNKIKVTASREAMHLLNAYRFLFLDIILLG